MSTAKNLTGQRFGRLVAIEPTNERRCTFIVWRCSCDCGREHLVTTNALQQGTIRSCGCLKREHPNAAHLIKDISGRRFGRNREIEVIRPTDQRSKSSVVWECRCDCGNILMIASNRLTGGDVMFCTCGLSHGKVRGAPRKHPLAPDDIKELRRQLGLTQRQLAELLNVVPYIVSNWETGKHRATGTALLVMRCLRGDPMPPVENQLVCTIECAIRK